MAEYAARLAQHVLVAQHLGTADIQDAPLGCWQVQHGHEVGEEIGERDWLCARPHPARRQHHGQVVDEIADDFKGCGPRTDDDPRAQLRDRHGSDTQDRPGFRARGEVARRLARREKAAEIDDLLEAGRAGGCGEDGRRAAVPLCEVLAAAHGMDEVVGGVHVGDGLLD